MIIRYTGVFAVMGFSHLVQYYESYTKETGLGTPKFIADHAGMQSADKRKMLSELKGLLTKEQKATLAQQMSLRQDAIILEDGSAHSK